LSAFYAFPLLSASPHFRFPLGEHALEHAVDALFSNKRANPHKKPERIGSGR